MRWFTKQRKKKARNTLLCLGGENFGFSSQIQGRFRPVSAVSVVGRYDPIWSIQPDFGRNSSVWRESKPIWHESSQVGMNPRKKKKKTQTWHRHTGNRVGRRVPRRAALDAGAAPSQPRPCFLDHNGVSALQ